MCWPKARSSHLVTLLSSKVLGQEQEPERTQERIHVDKATVAMGQKQLKVTLQEDTRVPGTWEAKVRGLQTEAGLVKKA
jgi:hypothetical protein